MLDMNGLHDYFSAERQAGLLAAVLGAVSFACAWYVWSTRGPFKAAAWPLVVIGLIELGVGVALVARTPSQVQTLEAAFAAESRAAAAAERERMARVNRSFRVIMAGELVLIIAGACLAFFLRTRTETWTAIGIALLLEAAVLLAFDLFAEHRAHVYAHWLSTL